MCPATAFQKGRGFAAGPPSGAVVPSELATPQPDQNRANVTLRHGSSLVTPEYQ